MKKYVLTGICAAALLSFTACKKENVMNGSADNLTPLVQNTQQTARDGGSAPAVSLGNLTNYVMVFTDGSVDANWQGATKGFVGDVAYKGSVVSERTSGSVPYAGNLYNSSNSSSAWQAITNQNPNQSTYHSDNGTRLDNLANDLNSAFDQIDALTVTPGYAARSATSLDGLNTQDGIAQTIVINITSGMQISSQIDITGDATDTYILRWDADANPSNGYQGTVKFQSGGGIVPHGGLTAGNFIHTAGNIDASGGGSNPSAPYPQGPRLNNGTGNLITGGSNFNGGGFFTGYWLTKGDPGDASTHSLSNAVFVGGWYTSARKLSMTSGTSAVYVAPANMHP